MSKDFYNTLELNRKCSQEEIAQAFRRLALKYHPKRNSNKDFAINNHYFNNIAEAYEVLSDPNKRGIYDVHGYETLRAGLVDGDGAIKGGYKYGGNAYEIFEKFFGTTNPFSLIKDGDRIDDEYGTMFSSAFGGQYALENNKLPDIVAEMECSLEELYNGCVKALNYSRRVLNSDGRTTSERQEEKDVEIFKGYDKTTRITFPGYGNEAPGMKNSDLIVVIKEKKHPKFKRTNEGQDLVYTHSISLVESLRSEPVEIQTLDDRKLIVTMDEIISPQTIKLIKGEGMPIFNKADPIQGLLFREKRGDLYIKFDIVFPKFIDPGKKDEIISLLEN